MKIAMTNDHAGTAQGRMRLQNFRSSIIGDFFLRDDFYGSYSQ